MRHRLYNFEQNVNQRDYDMLKRFEKILTGDEKKLLEEIGKIKGLI